jgi:hypothetical protein
MAFEHGLPGKAPVAPSFEPTPCGLVPRNSGGDEAPMKVAAPKNTYTCVYIYIYTLHIYMIYIYIYIYTHMDNMYVYIICMYMYIYIYTTEIYWVN